jgi:hypothetical protein
LSPAKGATFAGCAPHLAHVVRAVRHGHAIMLLNLYIGPVIALVAGILILIMPRLLNYIVAIYLIVTGLIGLFGSRL